MRKYQQLFLFIIASVSVIILILYKNENSRLKDVLHVVFNVGPKITENEKLIKSNVFPNIGAMPVWQALSESYHLYSAFWNRNELIAGGEVVGLVVGKRGAVVNFGCSLLLDNGLRSVRGKFHFQRIDDSAEDHDSEFTSYSFFCRVVRDFGNPEAVIFNDLTNGKHMTPEIRIRHIKPIAKSNADSNTLNVCVDMVTFNHSSNFTKPESNLLQFFLHHQNLGVTDFLIYNGDAIPHHVHQLLRNFDIRLHMLPFNFPFVRINATERVRRIIETDCLIRNTNIATYALFLQPNEFFYPNAKVDAAHSFLRSINHYTTEVNQFELPIFSVCMDRKNKLLIDSKLYDPELKLKHKIFIYRTHVPVTTAQAKNESKLKSVALSLPLAFAHSYLDCVKIGKDGLHDWRNSLREDFMQHLRILRNELDITI